MRKLFACYSLILLFTLTVSAQQSSKQPIIIDTDFAIDDWLAILYLLRHPNVDVLALTLEGTGEAHCDPGLRNLQNLLALADQPNIPVACGRETPLASEHVFPTDWRERVDTMLGIPLPENPNPLPEIGAVELLTNTISNSSEPIVLVTLGTLTNIAEFVQAEPELISQIEMTYIMGGAVDVEGNVLGLDPLGENFTAEWNLYADPHAAQITTESGLKITLVPLDATRYVPATIAFVNRLEADRNTPEAEFVYQALLQETDFIQTGGYHFWDPLTAVLSTDESFATILGRPIYVITEEGPESGRTVASAEGTRVRVVTQVDKQAFELNFINVLNGRDPNAPAPVSQSIAEGSEANADLLRRYYQEAWGENNLALLNELLDPAYLLYTNNNGFPSDLEGTKALIQMLRTAMPDLQLNLEEIIVAGDSAAVRLNLTGTHTGQFLQLAPTGNAVSLYINAILHLADNRIRDEWWTVDSLELFVQLGAISPNILNDIYGGE
jgi:inosine-uridine nucleoside N-ribohydrolase/predicted ester cyclase